MAITGCLIDVYDTVLASAMDERLAILAGVAGIEPQLWSTQWLALSAARDTGKLTMAGAFGATLAACGADRDPELVGTLVARDAELLVSATHVFADTVSFLQRVREAGVKVAIVSNCGGSTRQMLAAKGLLALADAAVLSCEAGVAKPDREIYLAALRALGVPAGEAVFLDDQPRFCAGAAAAGVRAIQVARPGICTQPADPAYTPVSTLADVLPLLSLP